MHNPLVVDPDLIAASIDYGFMRAADVVLGLDGEACRLSRDITLSRVAVREAAGPVPGPFGITAPTTGEDGPATSPDALRDRVDGLVARRREAGLPLPPGM